MKLFKIFKVFRMLIKETFISANVLHATNSAQTNILHTIGKVGHSSFMPQLKIYKMNFNNFVVFFRVQLMSKNLLQINMYKRYNFVFPHLNRVLYLFIQCKQKILFLNRNCAISFRISFLFS